MVTIMHDITALNAARHFKVNTKSKAASMEKLSSGYRVNRAADDAAGLTISEKMRSQIRGLNRGSQNVQEGISLIQTADGALVEMHSVLQRANELAVQAANDTNTDIDREAIQKEINEITEEINRISSTTTFNTRTILLADQPVRINTSNYSNITMNDKVAAPGHPNGAWGKVIDFSGTGPDNILKLADKRFSVTCSDNCKQTFNFEFTTDTKSSISVQATPGSPLRPSLYVTIGLNEKGIRDGKDIVGKIFELVKSEQAALGVSGGGSETLIGHANGLTIDGGKLIMYSRDGGPTYHPGMGMIHADELLVLEEDLNIQTKARSHDSITLTIRTVNSDTIGLSDLSVDSYDNANKAIKNIHSAIDKVSDYRSYLGAMQNRFEHVILNNDNSSENLQDAESKIRDTDMSKEIMSEARSSLLEQAGISLMSQHQQDRRSIYNLLNNI